MNSIGIGLIGCGNRLTGLVKTLLKDHGEQIKVTALCDPSSDSIDTAKRDLNAGTARVYEDYNELVKASDVDWVLVGSWNCFHREHAIAAMEAGKDVFCEKPLATSFEDCMAIKEVQQRTGKRFFIGFTLRYSPHYARVQQIIQSGAIGDILSLEFNETLRFNHGGYIHQDWRRLTDNAGTHLLEKCCHDIDIINGMVGSLARKVASFGGCDFFTSKNAHHADRIGPGGEGNRPAFQGWPYSNESPFRDDKDIIDNQVAIIEYANGIRATFHTNCLAAIPERRCYILGTEGTLRADALTNRIEVQRVGWDTKPEIEEIDPAGGHGGSDPVLVEKLADCILNGTEPRTGVDEGLKSAVTCFGIDQAMDEGTVVDLLPMWEQAGIDLGEPVTA